MKGLLIKDMKLMLGQIMYLLIFPIVGALIVVPSGELNMGFGYIASVSGLFAVTTINYDSYDNGYSFLFTMPVSRKGYVKEKYVFALLSSVVVMMAIGTALWFLTAVVHSENEYEFADFAGNMWSAYMVTLTALSFLLPIFLRYGAEKSRYIILILCGIFMALSVSFTMNETLGELLEVKIKGIVFLILDAALLLGSYAAACRIMEGKDF